MGKAEEIEKIISPVVEAMGFEVVDVQYLSEAGSWVVRIFADTPAGSPSITLADCEKLSAAIGEVLDKTDIIPANYSLEVSSPGVDRVLKKERDFLRFKGKSARVTTFAPIGDRRNFTGKILGFENDVLTLELEDKTTVAFNLKQVARARLVPEV